MSPVTLEDVARMAGVSTKTVSRVLNNESNVSPETTSEVKKAISYLNYVPNLAARSLSRGKAMALGLVIGWKVTSAFSSMLIEAMLSESMQRDHSLVLFSSEREIINPVRDAFLGRRVDGIIMDSKAAENPELTYLLHTLNKPTWSSIPSI